MLKRTIAAQLHTVGCLAMLVGAIVLLPIAYRTGSSHFWACLSFLGTGFLIFFSSSVYHFLSDGFDVSPQLRMLLKNLDHFSIYLFIAGSYTPFFLTAIAPPWRVPLLIAIWAIAVLGIAYTWLKPKLPKLLQSRIVYTGIFLAMGWILLIRIGEVYAEFSAPRMALLAAGGMSYSIGAVIYSTKRPKLLEGVFGFHELWHIMVLLGAGLHYFFILSLYRYPIATS